MRDAPRWPGVALLVAGLFAAQGCTSFDTAAAEFDDVARLNESDEWPEEVDYRTDPRRFPWVIRQLDGVGSGFVFRRILGAVPIRTEVENPAALVRECMSVLSTVTNEDLALCAVAGRRLLWVAELDNEHPLNQSLAIGGVEQVMSVLGFNPVSMELPDPAVMTPAMIDSWIEALNDGWPGTRDGESLAEDKRAGYVDALRQLTQLPLGSGDRQRALIGALGKGLRLEWDPELILPTHDALRRALYHGLCMGLRRGLTSESALVRETSIRAYHHLGGADSVPHLLALIAKPTTAVSEGLNRYDEDRFVRMALVNICGQLDRERATRSERDGPAAVEFLYETLFADPDAGMRTIALEALARCLGRPIDFDRRWAERWWIEDYVPNRAAAQR